MNIEADREEELMQKTRDEVSWIIPTFNGVDLLRENMANWLSMMKASDELILVDDASTDQTQSWLKDQISDVADQELVPFQHDDRTASVDVTRVYSGKSEGKAISVVTLAQNQRFARAVNTAALYAHNEVLFLLNSDVRVEANCRPQLVAAINSGDDIFAVGCLEKEEKGCLGGKNELWFERGLFQHQRATEFSSGPTAWVSGGSGLFDRSKWQHLRGFDPRYYPAYWEDVDLSFRARTHGWKVVFDAAAIVDHQHESTNSHVFSEQVIRRKSFEHQQLFTRIHATPLQKIQYWLWKPYWWRKMKI